MNTKKYNFLIVDDSSNLRQVIKRYIQSAFDGVFYEAGNGNEAESMLQERSLWGDPIDVVILDWMMPHFTGFEFLQKIRGTDAFQKQPRIIMLTAETNAEQINACKVYDVSFYLMKPFTQKDIVEPLKELLKEGVKHAV